DHPRRHPSPAIAKRRPGVLGGRRRGRRRRDGGAARQPAPGRPGAGHPRHQRRGRRADEQLARRPAHQDRPAGRHRAARAPPLARRPRRGGVARGRRRCRRRRRDLHRHLAGRPSDGSGAGTGPPDRGRFLRLWCGGDRSGRVRRTPSIRGRRHRDRPGDRLRHRHDSPAAARLRAAGARRRASRGVGRGVDPRGGPGGRVSSPARPVGPGCGDDRQACPGGPPGGGVRRRATPGWWGRRGNRGRPRRALVRVGLPGRRRRPQHRPGAQRRDQRCRQGRRACSGRGDVRPRHDGHNCRAQAGGASGVGPGDVRHRCRRPGLVRADSLALL
ncbi:MAG: Putative membrane protein YeiH, partial [uncultured Nocardioidaceae bacterium]